MGAGSQFLPYDTCIFYTGMPNAVSRTLPAPFLRTAPQKKEQSSLNAKSYLLGQDSGYRDTRPRQINLPHESCIGSERPCRSGQTSRKINPQDIARHIKKELGRPICLDICDLPEYQCHDRRRKQCSQDKPRRSKDGPRTWS